MAIRQDQVKKDDYGYVNLLKVADLIATHSDYDDFVEEWRMLLAVYEGIKWIKYYGYIEQHERELDDTYVRRLKELYSLAYSKSIVDIFHYYLFKKDPKRTIGDLQENELWDAFMDDANLYGDSFDEVIMNMALYASIEGHVGILVDMPANMDGVVNMAQQKAAKLYPYIARYFPNCILDWEWGHDEYGRPCLVYLKLIDDDDQYRIWYRDHWEIWEIPDETGNLKGLSGVEKMKASNPDIDAKFVVGGINPIGEIPFIWHYNSRTKLKGIGRSDITEVSRIDLSIIRNLSQAEEIIGYAAFPMMVKPTKSADPREGIVGQGEDIVAPDVVLEFDPDYPEAQPHWLKTEVAAPLQALVEFIHFKVSEIYRTTNTGGIAATETSDNAKSGVALSAEFKLLNSQLVTKAILLEKTESRIAMFWLKWMRLWDKYKDIISMQRDRTFDVENLMQDLENAVLAKTVVISKTFNKLVQQQAARQVLPGASERDMMDIDQEIEDGVNEEENSKDKNPIDGITDEDLEEVSGDVNAKGAPGEPYQNSGKTRKVKRVKSTDAVGK